MNKAKQAEQELTEAAERAQAQWLLEHGAWNWQWPGDGETGSLDSGQSLPRNCWFTNNPKPRRYPKAPGTSAVGGDQHIVGTQTYYGVPAERKAKRKARRKAGGKRLAGLKMGGGPRGEGHSYSQMGV